MNSISFSVTSGWVADSDSQSISLVTVNSRLCSRVKVFRDKRAIWSTEVVDAVRSILAYVNLAVRIGDFVDDVHRRNRERMHGHTVDVQTFSVL